ncbi:MAG: AI-2E family transporter [Planktothrix sp. GU0601_MAG3]|nr:MAG: AI-2E family transporter [Planktothrix sp. GU0601_MAG3]
MDNLPPDSQDSAFWNQISTNGLVRFLLFFASGWALILIFNYFESIFFTFILAAIFAFLLNYPVRYLERYLGRGFALGIVLVLSLFIVVATGLSLGTMFFNQFQQLLSLVVENFTSTDNPFDQLQEFLSNRKVNINLAPLESEFNKSLVAFASVLVGAFSSLPNTLLSFIIIFVISFFMLIDGERLWFLLLKIIPYSHRSQFSLAVKRSFLGFFRGQLLLSLFLAISSFIVYSILGIPFSLSLAIIIGLFDFIPGIGATLGILSISLIILIQSGWFVMLKVVVASVILQQIQDNFIGPRIMQSSVNINPVVLFFALMIGARIAGILGVFLSVSYCGRDCKLIRY